MLTAAAVALSASLPALISLGVEVVLVAFRAGIHVGAVATRLELQRDGSSWGFQLDETTETQVQTVLSTIHQARVSNSAPLYAFSILILF